MPDLELTVKQAAKRLNRSTRTIRRWCQTGKLRGRKVDREDGLEEWRIESVSVALVRPAARRGQRPRGQSVDSTAEELRLLREEIAEYHTVIGQLVTRIAGLETAVRQLPPARSKPWWALWRRH